MMFKVETKNEKWQALWQHNGEIIQEFESEQELKSFLALQSVYAEKIKAINLLMTYPNQVIVNGKVETSESGSEEFGAFMDSLSLGQTYKEWHKAIDEKLEELLYR